MCVCVCLCVCLCVCVCGWVGAVKSPEMAFERRRAASEWTRTGVREPASGFPHVLSALHHHVLLLLLMLLLLLLLLLLLVSAMRTHLHI